MKLVDNIYVLECDSDGDPVTVTVSEIRPIGDITDFVQVLFATRANALLVFIWIADDRELLRVTRTEPEVSQSMILDAEVNPLTIISEDVEHIKNAVEGKK